VDNEKKVNAITRKWTLARNCCRLAQNIPNKAISPQRSTPPASSYQAKPPLAPSSTSSESEDYPRDENEAQSVYKPSCQTRPQPQPHPLAIVLSVAFLGVEDSIREAHENPSY
jgi:hypothetical protein